MGQTKDKFAYKCLPLTIANQYGFAVLSPADFTVEWWGGQDPGNVSFNVNSKDSEMKNYFHTYFGGGTLTIHLDFIIKTPEGFSTYIRGVPNETKKGIRHLDAIVETDWLTYTFTCNFLFTEPGIHTFKKGEPLFTFFPIERNTVENFEIREISIESNPEFAKDLEVYDQAVSGFFESKTEKPKSQNFYRDGVKASGEKVNIKNHITNLIFGKKRSSKKADRGFNSDR